MCRTEKNLQGIASDAKTLDKGNGPEETGAAKRGGEIYANPCSDFVFKRIFGSECYKQNTINLLNSIIGGELKIKDVTFLGTELQPLVATDRKSIVDVLCQADDGSEFIVEMQNATHTYFRQRMMVYSSVLLTHMAERAKRWDYNLKPLYVIAFLNENLRYPAGEHIDSDQYLLHYVVKEERTGAKMPDSPEYFFFELGKFNKNLEDLCDEMEIWLYLLREAKFMTEIPEKLPLKERFGLYFDAAMTAGFTTEERIKYDEEMIYFNDYELSLREEYDKGVRQGVNDGRAEGKTEGKAEVARAMLSENVPIDLVCKFTGLSKAQLSAL